jgi:lactoylglutathione lyase
VNRLLYVMPYTHDMEEMKRFYRDGIGLEIRNESQFFVDFESGSRGASFALIAIPEDREVETELCFETLDVDREFETLKRRGVEFADEPQTQSFGKVVHLRDPEGRSLSLLQPSPGLGIARDPATSKSDPQWQAGAAGALAAGAASAPAALAVATQSPRFSTAILNCSDINAVKAFYREKLGFKLEMDTPWWVSFDVGGSILALHPRIEKAERERHHGQPITLGFTVAELIAWADEARERDVHFASAPEDQGFGMAADAADPDGNELTFREPPAPPVLEEELAEDFEDDATPPQAAIRKPLKKGARAASHVALKPEYKTPADKRPTKAARIEAAKRKGKKVPSVRGAGPERTRLTPKNNDDPKRAKLRPATGRLKKAERRTLERKKVAVAGASKSKPIKRAASSRGKKKR